MVHGALRRRGREFRDECRHAEHPRHRSDAELKAVADGGGVSGIFIMPYLARGRQPPAADVIAHRPPFLFVDEMISIVP